MGFVTKIRNMDMSITSESPIEEKVFRFSNYGDVQEMDKPVGGRYRIYIHTECDDSAGYIANRNIIHYDVLKLTHSSFEKALYGYSQVVFEMKLGCDIVGIINELREAAKTKKREFGFFVTKEEIKIEN